MRYALINVGGIVENVIDCDTKYVAPDGYTMVQSDTANIGAIYAKGVFSSPTSTVPAPTLAQQAIAAQAAGLTIGLSGTLTLTATVFPTDQTTQMKLAAVATIINTTGSFPGGATSYPMKDAAGAWYTFTLSQYKAVAAAIAAYAAALDLIIDGNPLGATALPVASASLTV